jgi:hypothetical protein
MPPKATDTMKIGHRQQISAGVTIVGETLEEVEEEGTLGVMQEEEQEIRTQQMLTPSKQVSIDFLRQDVVALARRHRANSAERDRDVRQERMQGTCQDAVFQDAELHGHRVLLVTHLYAS